MPPICQKEETHIESKITIILEPSDSATKENYPPSSKRGQVKTLSLFTLSEVMALSNSGTIYVRQTRNWRFIDHNLMQNHRLKRKHCHMQNFTSSFAFLRLYLILVVTLHTRKFVKWVLYLVGVNIINKFWLLRRGSVYIDLHQSR